MSKMRIGIAKEIHVEEKRVAATPEITAKLRQLGFSVTVESGAGQTANFSDAEYLAAGCEISRDVRELWAAADIILKVRAPELHPQLGVHESSLLKANQTLISFIWPGQNSELLQKLKQTQANVLAMDCVPRISRAQKLDALSSMANISGYRAVIEAAHHFGRFFTGQITAAGKVPPAQVLVIGAGVAGLSAIGTARGLGAIVRAFDTRPEVKDQVMSMGAEFLELDFAEEGTGVGGYARQMSEEFIRAEMKLFAEQAKAVDIVITTALIPGKKAPTLITAEMVRSMRAGSVIVDLAAEQGGNCELTETGKVVIRHGVTLIGYTDLPSRLARQSSQLYASNLWRLLEELCPKKDGIININMEDEVIRGTTIIKSGEITWPPPAPKPQVAASTGLHKTAEAKNTTKVEVKKEESVENKTAEKPSQKSHLVSMVIWSAVLLVIGQFAPAKFMNQLTVFTLSCFVGYMVVWNVKAALHTPLMSVTNAISGVIVVGAILQVSSENVVVSALAAVAILVSTINIVGGFSVTQRMLVMFKR